MKLLASQKAATWERLEAWGLDPNHFEWVELRNGSLALAKVTAEDHPWHFVIQDSPYGYALQMVPGSSSYKDELDVSTFNEVLGMFAFWCEAIRREEDAVDPWEARKALSSLISDGANGAGEDVPFTVEEQAQTAAALRTWEAQVQRALDEQTGEVGELKLYVARQFALLHEALATKTKRAWHEMARDFLINIGSSLTVACGPAAANVVVQIAHEVAQVGMKAIGH